MIKNCIGYGNTISFANEGNRMSKHKHYDVIEEWARTGKPVQVRYRGSDEWICCEDPNWFLYHEYRIKPEVIRYKRFISDEGKVGVFNEGDEPLICVFIKKWIDTEWLEVEV